MNLTDPATLLALLERHGLRPQKRWGQHFLTSRAVVDAILARLQGFAGVLEVGPGPGVLTRPLSERARVIAYEVDPIAVSALAESAPLAEVRHADALRVDLLAALRELPEPRAIVSNMPYQITAPLLTAFAGVRAGFSRAVLMMQREVGDRVMAPAGDREFGSLSVFLQSQFTIEKVFAAAPGAFHPPPKVASLVLQFEPNGREPDAAFFRLVRLAFAQPRKTLANNLASGLHAPRQEIVAALANLGWRADVRPHQVPLEDWTRLAERLGPEARAD